MSQYLNCAGFKVLVESCISKAFWVSKNDILIFQEADISGNRGICFVCITFYKLN